MPNFIEFDYEYYLGANAPDGRSVYNFETHLAGGGNPGVMLTDSVDGTPFNGTTNVGDLIYHDIYNTNMTLLGFTQFGEPVLQDGPDFYVYSNTGGRAGNIGFTTSGGPFDYTCFAAGTWIASPTGETRVEALRIGDLVRTASGRNVAVKWIGRQTINKFFAGERACLVRISKGTLDAHSDLYVTANHGMVLGGFVINAAALVNGTTIDFVPLEKTPDQQIVYHVELAAHDVIFGNGAASETYLDIPDRQMFDNYQEYLDLYGSENPILENPMPRIAVARLLPTNLLKQIAA